jgi:hypothetical protein
MQTVLDDFLVGYNQRRPHQGRNMNGRTPAKAFAEGLPKNTNQKDHKKPARKAA